MGALIAAGVITAAGAVTAGAMSMSAAGKAAKAQGAAAKAAARKEKKALKGFEKGQAQIESDLGQIQAPVYDYAAMQRDAEAESAFRRAQAFGGEAEYEALRRQALANIGQGLAGQLTQEELGQLRREQAYMQGAGFNPATARTGAITQRGPYNYLRAIGETARGVMGQSMNQLAQWTDIARAYTASPTTYGALQYQYGMGAANVGLKKVDIKADLIAAQYVAQTGQAKRDYSRQLEIAAANKAASDASAEFVRGGSAAVGSAITAGAGAYGQYAAAQGASTTPNKEGFYTGLIGAANASGVAPSQISSRRASGLGGYMGQREYWYQPGYVYNG